jgi:hypothetical protein
MSCKWGFTIFHFFSLFIFQFSAMPTIQYLKCKAIFALLCVKSKALNITTASLHNTAVRRAYMDMILKNGHTNQPREKGKEVVRAEHEL